jgi:hypothetical protein
MRTAIMLSNNERRPIMKDANTKKKKVGKKTVTASPKHVEPNKNILNVEDKIQRVSKQEALIKLLKAPSGATIDEMAAMIGWQRHSIRGMISGVLKKRLGLSIASAKEERGRIYRIAV